MKPQYELPPNDLDGEVFVPAALVLLLGDGAVDRGKRVLEKIVNDIRQRRTLRRLAI